MRSFGRSLLVVVLSTLICAAAPPPATGATLIVDPDDPAAFATIQAAIDAAAAGDEVLVTCGTYVENVVMRDGVSLRGHDPHCAIIDGDADGDTVVMPTITQPTALRGLTIRNALHRPGTSGSGILVDGGSPVISGNIVEDNGQRSLGHGIYFRGFAANDAPVITRNVIRGNETCCSGGGIMMLNAESATISTNLIAGNYAYYGGGIYAYGSRVTITGNTIVGNESYVGGGVWVYSPLGVLANNVVVFNSALIYGGGVWGSAMTFENNDVFGNVFDDWSVFGADPSGVDGNVSVDPRFNDMDDRSFAGFGPRSDSGLIDAGAASHAGAVDLRGIPRNVDGDADGLGAPDIGARENAGPTRLRFEGSELVWDDGLHEPMLFNLFRGDLATLKLDGHYTQDPLTVPGARHFCGTTNRVDDPDRPAPGRVFFYLAAALGAVEGSLGFDAGLDERTPTIDCVAS